MTRRQSHILLAAAVWTLYVWISRLVIMAGQDTSAGFKAVHAALALVSIGFALAVGKIGWDARRRPNRHATTGGEVQQVPVPESWNEPSAGMNLKS